MHIWLEHFWKTALSILPVTIVVIFLHLFVTPLPTGEFLGFLLGAFFVVIGLSIFLVGVELGISPLGSIIGNRMAKSNRILMVLLVGLILGFFISIAEPDLNILASQINFITHGGINNILVIIFVALGVAIMLTVGLIRIVFNLPLYKLLWVMYGIIFLVACVSSKAFIGMSFDASGATTGAMTVPFILALSLGVAALKRNGKVSEKDSFGLVGITSIGPILAMFILSWVVKTTESVSELPWEAVDNTVWWKVFFKAFPHVGANGFLSLLPMVLLTGLICRILWKSHKVGDNPKKKNKIKKDIKGLWKGMIFTFVGFVIFLVGVEAGFMDAGKTIGETLAKHNQKGSMILVGFILGVVTVLAEPAVHVLTRQIEDVTAGSVKNIAVLSALGLAVGVAIALAVIKIIVPELELWHLLLPGYIIALILTIFTPKLFVGIAFDSGGVASGPLTATFILAYTQGIASAWPTADVLVDGFGVIALVAFMPLVTLQILGLLFRKGARKF